VMPVISADLTVLIALVMDVGVPSTSSPDVGLCARLREPRKGGTCLCPTICLPRIPTLAGALRRILTFSKHGAKRVSACASFERSLSSMRSVVIGLLLSLVIPASAVAAAPVRTVAPPGNSGVSQYLETIPTAKGSKPSVSVVTGGGKGPGASGGSSALSPSTQRALDEQGSAGRQAAALANATAPARASHGSHASTGSAVSSGASAGTATPPAAAVLKAVTGSAAHGGLGPLLPVLLVLILLGGGALALRARRGGGATPDGDA